MRIDQFWNYLRQRLTLAIGIFLIISIGVAVWSLTRTPSYSAEADVYVTIAPTKATASLYQDSQYVLDKVKSYTAIATTPAVLNSVGATLRPTATGTELAKVVTAANTDGTTIITIDAADTSPERAAAIANAVAEQLSPTITKLEPTGSTAGVKASVVQAATVPTNPDFPRNDLNIALGVLAGLLAGAGIAVAVARLDQTVRTSEEIEELTHASPLGTVGFDRSVKRSPIVVSDSSSLLTEDYRSIRARLAFAGVDKPVRRILVTSAIPGEGKSTVALNLAMVLAQSGSRVCLVEGDVRRPKVSSYLGVEGAVGLTDVLVGKYDLSTALLDWGNGLTVLPAGTNPPDPGELFASARMTDLMNRLAAHYDYLICDTPPLLAVADAAIAARSFDGAILVTRHGHAQRSQVAKAIEALKTSETRLIGTVLNAVPRRGSEKVYAYTPVSATA